MANSKFSISESIRFGWDMMKKNLGLFVGVLIVAAVFQIVPEFLDELIKDNLPIVAAIFSLVFWVIQVAIGIGIIKISLKITDSKNYRQLNLPSASCENEALRPQRTGCRHHRRQCRDWIRDGAGTGCGRRDDRHCRPTQRQEP